MLTLAYIKVRETLLNKKGVTALEYALIASAVAVVVIVGFQTLGTRVNTTIGSVATALNSVSGS